MPNGTFISAKYVRSSIPSFRKYLWKAEITCDGQLSLSSLDFLNKEFRPEYPNTLDLFDIVLNLSPVSTEVEPGFTQIKLISYKDHQK